MLKATIKSLLGRKLRLLMSTFAIVLGVAFVGGSLIFSDTLGRSFTALFASTVGDVVVRPADAGAGLGASTVTIPSNQRSRSGRVSARSACITTASFRATATAARLKPIRSLSLSPHVRRELSAEVRVKMTVAAS